MVEAIDVVTIVLSIANAIMLAINLLLINRRSKEGLQVSKREQRIKILEKSGLSTELLALKNKEELKITNIGELSIDTLSLDVCILTESGENLLEREYNSKGSLVKAQEFVVPLYSILKNMLKEKELISYSEYEMGTEIDPYSGRDVPIIASAWHAKKDFSLEIVVKTSYEVLGETKTQQDTFKLEYVIDPEWYRDNFVFVDSDNYEIKVRKISGEWQ